MVWLILSTWYVGTHTVPFLLEDLYHVLYPITCGVMMRFILRRADELHKPEVDFPVVLYIIAGALVGLLIFLPYRYVSPANSLIIFYILYVVGGLLPFVKIQPKRNG
jgi:hypothetical protein